MKRNPLKGAKGFTLIEIIVVMIIAGILAAIAITNLFTWIENSHCAEATQTLGYIDDQIDGCVATGQDFNQCSQNLFGSQSGGLPVDLSQYSSPNFQYFVVSTHDGWVVGAQRTADQPPYGTIAIDGTGLVCPCVVLYEAAATSSRSYSSDIYSGILDSG